VRYLQRAIELAADRGYLAYPEVRELQRAVPDWLLRIADPGRLAGFEQRHAVVVPAAVREFYQWVPLACFLEACYPEVFLSGYAEGCSPDELPPVIRWASGRYLVTGFHNHSGAVAAVAREAGDDPPEVWGFEDEADHDTELPVPFSAAVFELVDRYEQVLDELVAMYDTASSQPGGDMDWILDTPGVMARLEARALPGT
jgi:hypothetical protein